MLAASCMFKRQDLDKTAPAGQIFASALPSCPTGSGNAVTTQSISVAGVSWKERSYCMFLSQSLRDASALLHPAALCRQMKLGHVVLLAASCSAKSVTKQESTSPFPLLSIWPRLLLAFDLT